jgi:hypothetical protein
VNRPILDIEGTKSDLIFDKNPEVECVVAIDYKMGNCLRGSFAKGAYPQFGYPRIVMSKDYFFNGPCENFILRGLESLASLNLCW